VDLLGHSQSTSSIRKLRSYDFPSLEGSLRLFFKCVRFLSPGKYYPHRFAAPPPPSVPPFYFHFLKASFCLAMSFMLKFYDPRASPPPNFFYIHPFSGQTSLSSTGIVFSPLTFSPSSVVPLLGSDETSDVNDDPFLEDSSLPSPEVLFPFSADSQSTVFPANGKKIIEALS